MTIVADNTNITEICALVARDHHVKMISDPPSASDKVNSYPFEILYQDIDLISKLFTPVDIYQAIIGNRSYQGVRTPPSKAMELLKYVGIDQTIRQDFRAALGIYPIGTSVLLNTGDYGFVLNVPKDLNNLLRPQVVIFHGDQFKFSHSEVLDLAMENPLKVYIKEDLDPHIDFGTSKLPKTALEYFTNIKFQ